MQAKFNLKDVDNATIKRVTDAYKACVDMHPSFVSLSAENQSTLIIDLEEEFSGPFTDLEKQYTVFLCETVHKFTH